VTTDTGTSTQVQIQALLADHAAGITAKDARRVVAHYAPDLVSFDLAPPLQTTGVQAVDPAGLEAWFQTWDGPIGYETGQPAIVVGGDVAFSYGLTHMSGIKTDGSQVDLWFRTTVGLRRAGDGWTIVHEHTSTPFYMDGSDRAALDLRPS
jgi:ketosteroid isomerase-like protein